MRSISTTYTGICLSVTQGNLPVIQASHDSIFVIAVLQRSKTSTFAL